MVNKSWLTEAALISSNAIKHHQRVNLSECH